MPQSTRPTQWDRYVVLTLCALLGVLLILAAGFLEHSPFWKSAAEHLGTALFIASILGFTIDWWLTKRIAEDVFLAAMGYELPNELREEVRHVYGDRLICTEHVQTVWIEKIKDEENFLTVTVGLERTIKNIGSTSQTVPIVTSIDEWFVPLHPSAIIELGYKLDGTGNLQTTGFVKEKKPNSLLAEIKGGVELKPDRKLTIYSKFRETKPTEGEHYISFSYATSNPHVTVNAPQDFRWSVGFSHRAEPILGRYSDVVRLEGLLLPHQSIRVRWWRDAASQKWLAQS
jgi:hypothetical protein